MNFEPPADTSTGATIATRKLTHDGEEPTRFLKSTELTLALLEKLLTMTIQIKTVELRSKLLVEC